MTKLWLFFSGACVCAVLVGGGCGTLLTPHPAVNSLPVQLVGASTNDIPLIQWEELARAVNSQVNPTPTREPIDTILGAVIGLTGVLGGWYARHRATAQTKGSS
jgi:hypothetical protein